MNMEPKLLEKNFSEVQKILLSNELKSYLKNFVSLHSNFKQEIITETIKNNKEFIKKLSEKCELEIKNKTVEYSIYQLLIKSQTDNDILFSMMKKFGISDSETKNNAIESMNVEIQKLKDASRECFANDNEIDKFLEHLPDVLK